MKLSPLSIPYRGLQRASSLVVLAFVAASAGGDRLPGGRLLAGTLAAVAVFATIAYEVAYYERFEYELSADTLDIRSGVVSRRERELPYRRIQNVDVSRSALQRALGIAAVGFETAGGSSTEGTIRYVRIAEAERLQREIERRAGDGDDEADDLEELFALAPGELALAGALSFDVRIVGLVAVVVPGSMSLVSPFAVDPVALLMGNPLLALGLVVGAWLLGLALTVVNYYGFRLTRTGDELRYERGLVRRYSGSIPRSKVQAIAIGDNPAMRALGYATLTVETAGYAPGGGSQGSQAAVPIARRDRVYALADEIESFDAPAFERPPARVRRRYLVRYLLVLAGFVGLAFAVDRFLLALPWYWLAAFVVFTPPAAHLTWRHRGYWVGPDHVATRNGFWSRTITVVPHYRIQTIVDSRTLFQRRWGVATVTVDTAGSRSLVGSDAAAVDLAIPDAVSLRGTLLDRLGDALAARRPRG